MAVLLSAARWDSQTHPRLQDWLTAGLAMDYPALLAAGLGPDIPETLVARGEVLPVLDGLDELPDQARADMLTALNRSMCDKTSSSSPAIPGTVAGAGHLHRTRGGPVAAVGAWARQHGRALRPPLRSAHPRPGEHAAAGRRPGPPFRPQHTWSPEQVGHWLTYLSRQLSRDPSDQRDMAWWHLARYTSSRSVQVWKYALLAGAGYLIVCGLIRWVERPTTDTTARSPQSTWRADRNLTFIRILVGLGVGLVLGVLGKMAGQEWSLMIAAGLVLGLLIGLLLGRHHAWLAYTLTIPRLATKGRLPLRAMNFLDDAHRLGLLRTEGPYYQFRHVELQEHLARQPQRRTVGAR
ncbi:hypothetical protein AB0J43_24410 [Nonomuraea fuscirosea]